MDKDCKDCVFHRDTKTTFMKCDFPVPLWISLHIPGSYVSGYEAKTCATYKSKPDIKTVKSVAFGVKK